MDKIRAISKIVIGFNRSLSRLPRRIWECLRVWGRIFSLLSGIFLEILFDESFRYFHETWVRLPVLSGSKSRDLSRVSGTHLHNYVIRLAACIVRRADFCSCQFSRGHLYPGVSEWWWATSLGSFSLCWKLNCYDIGSPKVSSSVRSSFPFDRRNFSDWWSWSELSNDVLVNLGKFGLVIFKRR